MDNEQKEPRYIGDVILERLRQQFPQDMKEVDFVLCQAGMTNPDGTARPNHLQEIRSIVIKRIPSTIQVFDKIEND